MRTTPARLMTLHLSHIVLTLTRTFISQFSYKFRALILPLAVIPS